MAGKNWNSKSGTYSNIKSEDIFNHFYLIKIKLRFKITTKLLCISFSHNFAQT